MEGSQEGRDRGAGFVVPEVPSRGQSTQRGSWWKKIPGL